jgi:quercetin dioxygenase-like cupin family protein
MADRPLAVPDVQIDNDGVRVTEWRFEPGAATGHHRHEFDYVVVPITTGSLTLREDGGERVAAITSGRAYFREAGVEHDVINDTDRVIVFIEIELKTRTKP